MWAHSWLWEVRKHWVARWTWVTISSWERCCFQGAGIWLMDVSKCNSGSRWPKRNRKDALLQHLVGLRLTPVLACLGSSDSLSCYQLRTSLGEELPEFSCPWVCPWVLSGKGVLHKGLWYCSLTPVHSKHSFSTDDSVPARWMLKTPPVNLVWKKVSSICWLRSGQREARLMDGKHPNKRVEVWERGGAWVQTQCYTPLAGRPLTGHLTSLCSNKPNCKFVYKLKTRCCIWKELAQAKILNSHL